MTYASKAEESIFVLDSKKQRDSKFDGFDFLRAIFSIAIVGMKVDLFYLAEILVSGSLAYVLKVEFVYLAVPVFLQISLFLLNLKLEQTGFLYFFKKRLPRLMSLYVFWVGAKILFDYIFSGSFDQIKSSLSSPKGLIELIVSGAQSPFFFFFALLFLSTTATLLSVVMRRIRNDSVKLLVNYGLLFATSLLVFSLSVIEIVLTHFSGSAPGWVRSISSIVAWDYNPIAFLPYLFTAAITVYEFNSDRLSHWSRWLNLKLSIILFLTIFFSVLEWNLFSNLLNYSRLSLLFGSWLLLYLALLSPVKPSNTIKFISSSSLGIYGFHVFFAYYLSGVNNAFLLNLFQGVPGLAIWVGFILVLACSIAMTVIFKKIKVLKDFV